MAFVGLWELDRLQHLIPSTPFSRILGVLNGVVGSVTENLVPIVVLAGCASGCGVLTLFFEKVAAIVAFHIPNTFSLTVQMHFVVVKIYSFGVENVVRDEISHEV